MKIAVVAANGRSGRVFVDAALKAGHLVTAGVRGEHSLPTHQNLTIVECDATNTAQAEALIAGHDAVVSFIGHVKGSPAQVQTDAMKVICAAMTKLGIVRIVSLTGTGVQFAGDKVGLVDWFLNTGITFVDPARIKDGKDHVAVLQSSLLDWTVLRVLKLQNIKPTAFILKEHGPTKWMVSREEVAVATLEVLGQQSFIKQAPILSKV